MMTMKEAQALFLGDYNTAIERLKAEAESNGWGFADYGNAGTMGLLKLATSYPEGHTSVVTGGTGGNGAPVGGSCSSIDGEGDGKSGDPSSSSSANGNANGEGEGEGEGDGEGEPSEPSGGEPSGEPNGEGDGDGEGGEPQSEPQSAEPSGEPQSNNGDGKRKRNTPSWKSIAEEEKAKAEKAKAEMQKQMEEMKSSMQKQIDEANAKAEESEPETPEEAEAKAEELLAKANALREEARRKAEEEAKARAKQSANTFHRLTNEVVRRTIRLHNNGAVVYMSGPAGSGKTTLAMDVCRKLFGIETRAEVITGDKFAFHSLTADTMTSNLLGMTDANGIYHETKIVKVFRDGGIILFDEIDNGDANIMAGLNAMVANASISTPNGIVHKHPDTHILWAGNTWGLGANSMYTGRNRMDAATLDRGVLGKIFVDYDASMEKGMCESNGLAPADIDWLMKTASKLRNCITNNKWKHLCSTRFVQQACAMMVDIGNPMSPAYSHEEIIKAYLEDKTDNERRIIMQALA